VPADELSAFEIEVDSRFLTRLLLVLLLLQMLILLVILLLLLPLLLQLFDHHPHPPATVLTHVPLSSLATILYHPCIPSL